MTETILFCLVASSMTVTSSNNEFSAEVVYDGATELAVNSFTLYGRASEVVYHKEMLRVQTFFIHDSGVVFALNERELFFFREDGEEFFLQYLTHPNGSGFSEDGSIFFVSDRHGIFAYSNAGEPVHEFCPGRLFAGLDQGNKVAIISTDTLFLYVGGVLKGRKVLSTPYARRVRFSDDKRSLVIDMPGRTEALDFGIEGEAGQE